MMRGQVNGRTRGFSLIELLVAMAIGLILTLAITSVLIRSEGSKRSSTSVNDINQSGAYATYVLDRTIRSAGSGFAQSWTAAFGCQIDAAVGGAAVLPMAASMPASSAFAKFGLPVRLAPVVIGQGLADNAGETRGDVLMVMAGTAGVGESPQTGYVDVTVTPPQLKVPSGLGYVDTDMVLIAGSSAAGCTVQQLAGNPAPAAPTHAASNPSGALPLGGTYFNGASATLLAYTGAGSATALQIGRDAANPPQFKLYGVGANSTLFSYDLLIAPTATPPPEAAISDGIVEMRAVYGVDTNSDGNLDTWSDATGEFAASALSNGTDAAQKSLRKIVAVRIGLILRTSLAERSAASASGGVLNPEGFVQATGTTLTLFSDLPVALQKTRTLTTAELAYRFRTVEITIPLRNVLLAP